MEWNGSTPYGSTKHRDSSGNGVMIALTSTTPTARQPPRLPLCGNPHDFHSVVRGGIQQMLHAPQHRARVPGRHASTVKTELPLRIPMRKVPKKTVREKRCWPHHGFATSPEVGPGATVGTLETRYPSVQVLGQDRRQHMQITCPCVWLTSA
jgi:hypothetical protein